MKIDTTWLVTGRPGAVLPELTDFIYSLRSGFTALKPGATASPRSRSSRHRTDGWHVAYPGGASTHRVVARRVGDTWTVQDHRETQHQSFRV